MTQQRWASSETKAQCKHSRHLDPFWRCMEQMCTAQCPAPEAPQESWASSTALHRDPKPALGSRAAHSTLCCPGLWAGCPDASWAISAWGWIPLTGNTLLGLLNSTPLGKWNGRNAIGSRWSISNQRRGMTTQSVLAPNHSDKSEEIKNMLRDF